MNFAIQADHREKLKECEKRNKYLDLARELKKMWNMKVTIIPIVIGVRGIVAKGLIQGLEDLEITGRVETALLKSDRILRRVLLSWGDLSLKLKWKTHQITLMWKTLKNYDNNNNNNNNNNRRIIIIIRRRRKRR